MFLYILFEVEFDALNWKRERYEIKQAPLEMLQVIISLRKILNIVQEI